MSLLQNANFPLVSVSAPGLCETDELTSGAKPASFYEKDETAK